jgi:hypothetical protein
MAPRPSRCAFVANYSVVITASATARTLSRPPNLERGRRGFVRELLGANVFRDHMLSTWFEISRWYRRLAGEAAFEVVEGFAEVVREPVFGV